jgi:hypothetical protein
MKEIVIDTGAPRNVLGHVISGAIASAVISGAINYKKAQSRQITKNEAIKDTIKRTSQGAIAIATANYLGQKGGLFKALTAVSIGMMGIYALEVIEEKLDQKYLTNENCSIEEEIYE